MMRATSPDGQAKGRSAKMYSVAALTATKARHSTARHARFALSSSAPAPSLLAFFRRSFSPRTCPALTPLPSFVHVAVCRAEEEEAQHAEASIRPGAEGMVCRRRKRKGTMK